MSHKTPIRLRTELRNTVLLAGPIVLNQVGHMSMGMVDTMVAGRISTVVLAGLGLAVNCFWTLTAVCQGSLLALDTFFAQAEGAGDQRNLSRYLGQSFWASGIVTLVSGGLIALAAALYLKVAPASGMRDAFAVYLGNIFWCLPSLFIFFVLQRYWQARHRVAPFTIIIVAANVLNLFACLALGLGKWGSPSFGIRGIAWATNISRYAMAIAAVLFTWRQLRPTKRLLPALEPVVQREFFRLGLPAASHTALEVGAFTIATFVVGTLGNAALAAHHVCLMMAAFTFMFPLGFSSAAAVRVGGFIGGGDPFRARVAGWLAIGLAVTCMGGFAIGYLTIPRLLLGCFTEDPAVVGVGVKILLLVALFQIADGTQVSTTGALRGLGDTRTAMWANLVGHYPIGLAIGLVLCFGFGYGVVGMWAGLACGLVTVALLLVRAWCKATREPLRLRAISAAEPAVVGPNSGSC
ncbi:MAG TPA: MATE family efflux transporter [Patescibacteria group bacterium]|nr:MATE family efflux transporter [Patescibacteria group bacterium]